MKWIHILETQPEEDDYIVIYYGADHAGLYSKIQFDQWILTASEWKFCLLQCIETKKKSPDYWWMNVKDFILPDEETKT